MSFTCYSDFPSPYGSIDLKNNNKLSDNPSAGFDFQKMKTKDDAIPTNLSDSIEVRMSKGQFMISCMNNIRRQSFVINVLFENCNISFQITTSKFQRKKSLVAWMVSNCYTASRRESYVFELQKYIQVDVYGDCINAVSPKNKLLSCPKRLKDECWDMINEKYKVLSYSITT